eukprot:250389_1
MNLNPQNSVTDPSPEKSLSPTIVDQFNNISFQQSSQTHLFQNDTNTNNHHSPHKPFSNDPNNSIISQKPNQNDHYSVSQSDHSSPSIANTQTIATNQENVNPNSVSTVFKPSIHNTPSPKQTTDNIVPQTDKTSEPKPPAKAIWKQEFNKLIRQAKEHEGKKEPLLALKTYLKASKLAPKTYSKLLDKIERVQDKCYDLELHETEEAFEQIDDTPWYLNVITDNYHIERERKEDEDEDNGNEDQEELEYILPGDIYDKLYDYQRECLLWFWKIYQSPNGGILGDDMGLGKTVQMSAFLHGAFLSGLVKCCILIVPVSVMAHWIKELNKWCDAPGFRIRKYHSSITKKRRAEHLATIAKRGGVLITTYGMVQKNFAVMGLEDLTKKVNRDGEVVREGRKWDYMVLDEGHKIKNHLIGTSKAVRQIPVDNSNKIILSGTFLQNQMSELWSLFDFISEGELFGSYRAFNQEFAVKINAGRLKNASLIQKQISNRLLNLIKNTIKPYLMRRTKAEIRQKQEEKRKEGNNSNKKKELTPVLQCQKRELVIWVTMSSIQVDLYRTFLESDVVKETLNTTKSPLAALTVLKKICDHPFLLSDKMANCAELTRLQDITRDRSISNILATSNKMHVLLAVLKHLIDNKHRILVFSQYKIILSMIEPILNENKMAYLRMDGDTPIDERQKFVDAFNKRKDLSIFLLSTRVGGLGLNLVGSDRVIIYDPAWNPATDAQAVDRSYRIGQLKDVMVYRFVTCGTIEEKIYRRQISKVGLLKSVTGRTNQHRYFSKAELKEVFKLENPQESQTQIQFKDLHAHRIGTNAAFDTESNYVEQIRHVYGISHHDLLFRTCPPEELEENPELAKQMADYQKKLTLQTPKPRTTRKKKKPQTNPKIDDILEGRLDLSRYKFNNIMSNNNNNHNKNIKKSTNDHADYNTNHNLLNSSNSMDIDEDDEQQTKNDMANVSFISNVSSIHPVQRHDDNGNSWTDNQVLQRVVHDQFRTQEDNKPQAPIPMSTAKKTRTLRKKQNRFIADSDSDHTDNENGFNAFSRQTRPQFDLSNMNNIKPNAPHIAANVILQTPIFQKHIKAIPRTEIKANIIEDQGIDMKDIVSVIRTQPRRKRRKSMANLKQLLNAQESDDNDEDNEPNPNKITDTNDAYDSEATVSEANMSIIQRNRNVQQWQSGANQSALSHISPAKPQPSQHHSIFGGSKEPSRSQSSSFISDNNVNQSHHNTSYQSQSGANHSTISQRQPPQASHHSIFGATNEASRSQNNSFLDANQSAISQRQSNHNSMFGASHEASNSRNNSFLNNNANRSRHNTSYQSQSGANQSAISQRQPSQPSHHSIFGASNDASNSQNSSFVCDTNPNQSYHNTSHQSQSATSHGQSSIFGASNGASKSQSTSFIFDNNQNQSVSYDSKHNEDNTTNEATNAWPSATNQSGLSHAQPPQRNRSNNSSFVFDNDVNHNTSYHSQSGANHSSLSQRQPAQPSHHSVFDNNPNDSNISNHSTLSQRQPSQPQHSVFAAPNETTASSSNSFTFDNNTSYDSKHNDMNTAAAANPYLDDQLINTNLQSFSVQQNKSFEQMYHANDENQLATQHNTNCNQSNTNNDQNNAFTSNTNGFNVNAQCNTNDTEYDDEEYDDEETLSDAEMFDLSNEAHSNNGTNTPSTTASRECIKSPIKSPIEERQESVTAQQIFENDEIEKMDKALSIEPQILQSVSPEKRKEIKSNYKRYRRKSFIPRIEEYDQIDDDEEETEDEEPQNEQKEMQNHKESGAVTVCDMHRRRANGIESFEYECVKCECYLSEDEKKEYEKCIKLANEAEEREDWTTAIEMTMCALTICNSDPAVHAKCLAIADHLNMC